MTSDTSPQTDWNESGHAETFMHRCLHLAALGSGYTAPNPMVGAVLVHKGRIIGEGYHAHNGEAHAEVNCIQSVKAADRSLISSATLYVSLEPCCHHGKTPPCTDLILREKIPRVVIACRDPFPMVDGKGMEKLQANGVLIEYPVLEKQAKEMNRRFFTFHEKKRPYIILKWAESANRMIAGKQGKRIQISNPYSNRLVHKWRTEEAGILVGTNTALLDNPELTTRLWPGKNPYRIVIDRSLRLPDSLKIFDGTEQTLILNATTSMSAGKRKFLKLEPGSSGISSILSTLHSASVLSVLVEGGAKLLQSFIDEGIWDELIIITNAELQIPAGISSPVSRNANLVCTEIYGSDTVRYYANAL
jgi:diaminohydroxyphosphoribosylaminopyrimidine deaminase / 5-amino-6-(5-phosphoribosylamino)uracil reductase